MTALMAAAIFGTSVSCTDSKQMQAEGNEAVAELKEWLMIQEDNTCAIPQDEKTGDYFIGADNAEDAAKVAWNLSMGASGSESLKTTIPDSRGSISVAANAAEGHYYDISYNVTGIPVTKLSIVNNA